VKLVGSRNSIYANFVTYLKFGLVGLFNKFSPWWPLERIIN
jgi:hypothetical protein